MMEHIKSGDRVWVGTRRHGAKSIRTVSRVTPTQIVIDWNGNGSYHKRFRRQDGRAIAGAYLSDDILRLAAPEQCAEWDAKQAAELEQMKRERVEQDRLEALRCELADLFGESVSVAAEQWGKAGEREGKWTVEFHGLNEESVRELANRAAKAKAAK